MLAWLDVNHIFFVLWGYPISYIEFFATLLYLWSVWLIAKEKMLTWPVGIASVLLFMALFYQIRLYGDALEQIYYLGASLYGWWRWLAPPSQTRQRLQVRRSSLSEIAGWAIVTLATAWAAGAFLSQIHHFLPAQFPEPASYPYWDALTTIMSFTAMGLMAQKRIESWCYWLIVDGIGVGLYYFKGIHFIALLYVVLFGLAVRGFITWTAISRRNKKAIGGY